MGDALAGKHGLTQSSSSSMKGSRRLGEYLRSLRTGYGYSLRKVEERARVHGGEIDNSQLSRYEKGICYPSFDKLRTLSRIFNVSIQTFSDVVDIEEIEKNQPLGEDPRELIGGGHTSLHLGDYAAAYAHYQKARLIVEDAIGEDEPQGEQATLLAKARLAAAIALFRMGKVSLCEYEIRQLLRFEQQLEDELVVRALLQLSNAHVALGDFFLAEMEAKRSLDIALDSDEEVLQAYAHHALGHIYHDQGELDRALEHHHEALERYRTVDDRHEALKVKLNLGSLYATRGQFKQGCRMLLDAREEAKELGQRWTVASAGTILGEIHFKRGDFDTARRYMRESNAIASNGEVQYTDILFLNAFYLWKIALAEGNTAESKIALGRLKYLRPSIEQNLAEVREFDRYMEKGGSR